MSHVSYNTIYIADYFSLLILEELLDMYWVCLFIISQVAVKSEVSRSLASTWKTNHKNHVGSDHCTVIFRTVDVP